MKQYTNLKVKVKDSETHDVMKIIVNQLVEKQYVEKLVNDFVKFAETKGYYIETFCEGIEGCIIMLSKNGMYYLVIESYLNLEVNNKNVDMNMAYFDRNLYSGV